MVSIGVTARTCGDQILMRFSEEMEALDLPSSSKK